MKNQLSDLLNEAQQTFGYTVEELSWWRDEIVKYTTKVLLNPEARDDFNKELENDYSSQ